MIDVLREFATTDVGRQIISGAPLGATNVDARAALVLLRRHDALVALLVEWESPTKSVDGYAFCEMARERLRDIREGA